MNPPSLIFVIKFIAQSNIFTYIESSFFFVLQSGKVKGKMEAAAPIVDVRKTRDLERALEKAKNENLQQHLQLTKARGEVTTLRTERKSKANLTNFFRPFKLVSPYHGS